MVLLNPSILNTIKGLEVDSVLTLEYLSQILTAVEKAPRIITQAPAVQQAVSTDSSVGVPEVDLSILDQLTGDGGDDTSFDEDDPFSGLANFLEGS